MELRSESCNGGPATAKLAFDARPPEVLDLEKLYHRCMGNIDLVQRVLTKFQLRFPEELAELEKAVADNNAEQAARVAHRVKGTAGNISAEGLHQIAAKITELSRAGRLLELHKYLTQLRGEWQRYLDHTSALPLNELGNRVGLETTTTSEAVSCVSSS